MKRKGATSEERDECILFYRKVNKVMDDYDFDVVMNTLCFIIGEVGPALNMSKQAFIANVVNQISSAYDMTYLSNSEPQGEA